MTSKYVEQELQICIRAMSEKLKADIKFSVSGDKKQIAVVLNRLTQ